MSGTNRRLLIAFLWISCASFVMCAPSTEITAYAEDDEVKTRDDILNSRRWRQLQRRFDEWLSVQNAQTDQQVVDLKARLDGRIDAMTAVEIEDFMYDSEERLNVLMSEDAVSARAWLGQLTMEGRQRMLPDVDAADVFDMTVAQLRQELRQFQEMRNRRAAAQQQFNRSQGQRTNARLQQRRAEERQRQQASSQIRQQAAQNMPLQQPGPYTPRPNPLSQQGHRSMYITPWGGVAHRFDF